MSRWLDQCISPLWNDKSQCFCVLLITLKNPRASRHDGELTCSVTAKTEDRRFSFSFMNVNESEYAVMLVCILWPQCAPEIEWAAGSCGHQCKWKSYSLADIQQRSGWRGWFLRKNDKCWPQTCDRLLEQFGVHHVYCRCSIRRIHWWCNRLRHSISRDVYSVCVYMKIVFMFTLNSRCLSSSFSLSQVCSLLAGGYISSGAWVWHRCCHEAVITQQGSSDIFMTEHTQCRRRHKIHSKKHSRLIIHPYFI